MANPPVNSNNLAKAGEILDSGVSNTHILLSIFIVCVIGVIWIYVVSKQKKMNMDKSFSLRTENWPFWVGISLIILGLYLSLIDDHATFMNKFVLGGITELGFALVIAHVIILTVDKSEKAELRQDINIARHALELERKQNDKRISSKLYLSSILDVDLPENISHEFEKYILSSKLLKREQIIQYKIEPLGNFTKFTQILEGLYENVYRNDYSFQMPFRNYDKDVDLEIKFPNETFGILSLTISYNEFRHDEDTIILNWSPKDKSKEGDFVFEDDEVRLRNPILLRPSERVRVRIERTMVKFAKDNEIFNHTFFSENQLMDVFYDKNEYFVAYRCIHPRSDDCMQVHRGTIKDSISFGYPFLPGNGVVVWWKRRTNAK
jgi:hypothetical protein